MTVNAVVNAMFNAVVNTKVTMLVNTVANAVSLKKEGRRRRIRSTTRRIKIEKEIGVIIMIKAFCRVDVFRYRDVLDANARLSVASSIYSSSVPIGIPYAIRVTFTSYGCRSLLM